MFRKAFKRLSKVTRKPKKKSIPSTSSKSLSKPSKLTSTPTSTPISSSRVLTAEGWRRLVMKKYRKSK